MTETLHNLAAGLHDRLLDGELDQEGVRWLVDHRRRCAACDARFARMDRLALALGGLERPLPRAGFADRILARVRPAPLPIWARWQIPPVWGRAASLALLVLAGLAFLAAPSTAGGVLQDLGGLATLLRSPVLLAHGVVAMLDVAELIRPFVELASVLVRALAAVVATPAALATLAASSLVSGLALLHLSHVLALPQRRRSSHV